MRVRYILQFLPVVVDEQRVVGILLRMPLVELRHRYVCAPEKLVWRAELRADVRRDGSGKRHGWVVLCGKLVCGRI